MSLGEGVLAPRTDWRAVAVVVAAGVVSAYHLGKVPIAGAQLQSALGLSLGMLGALGATFALLGAVGGMLAGSLVARVGDRRMLAGGLVATTLGTVMALALHGSFGALLASRVVEGLGFLLITVAGPAVIARLAHPGDRHRAMALWSCFMPGGMALAMLTGPWLGGWQGLWATAALASGLIAAWVVWQVPAVQRAVPLRAAGSAAEVLRSAPLALAATFLLYSLMFFALFSFLPVLLQERLQVSPAAVGLLTAIACAANIAGNLAAGAWLKKRGRVALVRVAAAVMGVCALGIFVPGMDPRASLGLCLLFSAAGGMVPASLLSSIPQVAATPAHATLAVGLLMQGSNLGQALGPVLVGSAVDRHGWPAAAVWVVAAALAMAWAVQWRARPPGP
jgi:predicted MFS family arabinose efflux permease